METCLKNCILPKFLKSRGHPEVGGGAPCPWEEPHLPKYYQTKVGFNLCNACKNITKNAWEGTPKSGMGHSTRRKKRFKKPHLSRYYQTKLGCILCNTCKNITKVHFSEIPDSHCTTSDPEVHPCQVWSWLMQYWQRNRAHKSYFRGSGSVFTWILTNPISHHMWDE